MCGWRNRPPHGYRTRPRGGEQPFEVGRREPPVVVRDVVPLRREGDGQKDPARGPQAAVSLGQEGPRLGDVLEHLGTQDRIIGFARDRPMVAGEIAGLVKSIVEVAPGLQPVDPGVLDGRGAPGRGRADLHSRRRATGHPTVRRNVRASFEIEPNWMSNRRRAARASLPPAEGAECGCGFHRSDLRSTRFLRGGNAFILRLRPLQGVLATD